MKARSAKNNHYLVAIPFGYSISDVTLRKSSQWNVLDLIVIRRIARERVTLDGLVVESNLNRQSRLFPRMHLGPRGRAL